MTVWILGSCGCAGGGRGALQNCNSRSAERARAQPRSFTLHGAPRRHHSLMARHRPMTRTALGIAVLSTGLLWWCSRPLNSELPSTPCPRSGAEVRLATVDDPAPCGGRGARDDDSVGVLISTTTKHAHSEAEPSLRRLLKMTAMRPRLIYVAVDRSSRWGKWLQAAPIWLQRVIGALIGSPLKELRKWEDLARRLHAVSDGVPVIVDVLHMRTCTGRHLALHAFGCSSWLPVFSPRCWTPLFDKNSISYLHGIARLRACVRYVVHTDPDQALQADRHLSRHQHHRQGERNSARWLHRAVSMLRNGDDAYAIMPLPNRQTSCARRRNETSRVTFAALCDCPHASSGWLRFSRGHQLRYSVHDDPTTAGAVACGELLNGHDDRAPHFSFQAFVLDADRFVNGLWPLPVEFRLRDLFHTGGPLGHVEVLLERAEMLAATRNRQVVVPVFVHSSDLGVFKHTVALSGAASKSPPTRAIMRPGAGRISSPRLPLRTGVIREEGRTNASSWRG